MATHSRSRSLTAAAGLVAAGAVTFSVTALPALAGADTPSQGNSYQEVKLVADRAGQARTTDRNLVNPWGLAASSSSPVWVSNNGTSTSTLYQGATAGRPFRKVPLTVRIPGGGSPTGVVHNSTQGFRLSQGGKTGPALFIFAGENGDISAWNQSGDTSRAVLVAHAKNAVYKGLTIVTVDGKPYLLVADFHGGRIHVYNDHFRRVPARKAFRAANIPHGYAPFDVANLGGRVYVTYAQQDARGEDDVAGPGKGFVNVYDQSGRFLDGLVRRGVLNAPWGLVIAPQGFGPFSGKLLVGNFGDGRIHAVDQQSGQVVGTLRGRHHKPIVIDGLWGLLPGNGTAGSPSDVWFSAGPDDEAHGLLGILRHR